MGTQSLSTFASTGVIPKIRPSSKLPVELAESSVETASEVSSSSSPLLFPSLPLLSFPLLLLPFLLLHHQSCLLHSFLDRCFPPDNSLINIGRNECFIVCFWTQSKPIGIRSDPRKQTIKWEFGSDYSQASWHVDPISGGWCSMDSLWCAEAVQLQNVYQS